MIAVAGEALFDVFARRSSGSGLAMDAHVGGSPFNVAVGLARLGHLVTFLGSIEQGPLGDVLLEAMWNEGIDVSRIQRVYAPTTLLLVALDARGVPAYTFYGTDAADRELGADALEALPAAIRAIHVGSYAMVVEPIASTLATLIDREHLRRVIAYDPNVRPNVEPRLDRWRSRLEWMLPRTHLLKISARDLDRLYPGASPHQLALQWRMAGVGVVVLTQGDKGVCAWCAGGMLQLPAIPTQVADTVGAGDSFQAALLAQLAEREMLDWKRLRQIDTDALAQALHFAQRAAALTCSRQGADMPLRSELVDDGEPTTLPRLAADTAGVRH